MEFNINPNSKVISSLINNYESGMITSIYGNAASGKTTCCYLAAIAAKHSKVIFVDTESGFSIERIKQIDNNIIMDNIFLIQPKSFLEQHDTILRLKKLCENDKIKLVVVDTIGNHYRNVLNEDPKSINEMMVEQMKTLVRIARDLNKVVLMTNQVYSKMDDEIKMIGGSLIPKMCKRIVELRKDDDKRTATLIKWKMQNNVTHYKTGKKVEFEIVEKGLRRL